MTDRRLLKPKEVAAIMSVRIGTLAAWRHRGIGPVYAKIGGCIRYEPASVDAYLERMRRSGTGARC